MKIPKFADIWIAYRYHTYTYPCYGSYDKEMQWFNRLGFVMSNEKGNKNMEQCLLLPITEYYSKKNDVWRPKRPPKFSIFFPKIKGVRKGYICYRQPSHFDLKFIQKTDYKGYSLNNQDITSVGTFIDEKEIINEVIQKFFSVITEEINSSYIYRQGAIVQVDFGEKENPDCVIISGAKYHLEDNYHMISILRTCSYRKKIHKEAKHSTFFLDKNKYKLDEDKVVLLCSLRTIVSDRILGSPLAYLTLKNSNQSEGDLEILLRKFKKITTLRE